jgi:hypothetical protein
VKKPCNKIRSFEVSRRDLKEAREEVGRSPAKIWEQTRKKRGM